MYHTDLYSALDGYNNCEGSRVYFSDLIKSLNHNNIIQVPGGINSTRNPKIHRQSIEYILNNSNQHSDKPLIIFNWVGEGYVIEYIELMHSIIQELVEKYNYTQDQFLYLTGAAHSLDNIKKYRRLHTMFRYLPLKVGYVNHWEYYQEEEIAHNPFNVGRIDHSVISPINKKKFLCLNGQPRPHRIALLSELENLNLLEDNYFTATRFQTLILPRSTTKTIFPSMYESITRGFSKLKDKFPVNLTLNENNMHSLNSDDAKLYSTSLFSLVTETLYTGKLIAEYSYKCDILCYPCMFFTEKTFKPIRAEHPFILVSASNSLAHLRELGYKTFSPYIDETYDTIDNPERRMKAIIDEVKRLCNMTDDEIINWSQGVKQITTHNYHKLKETKLTVKFEDFV